jgi:hypothetical protein
MLKRRFILYIVGAGVVAFLSLSYVGYRAYQKQVEFEAFMSNAQAFNRSINGHYVHSSKDHTHGSGDSPAVLEASEHKHTHHPYPADGKYVYEVAGVPIYADSPMSQEDLEMEEWLITGKMTPAAEEYLKNRPKESRFDGHVIQRVVGPDGNLYKIIVPSQYQYEEGNAVLRSELDVPEKLKPSSSHITSTIGINGVEYNLPEEYYIIEDRYERELYKRKFITAKELGGSMAEVEKQIAAGNLDVSLSEAQKRFVDQQEAERERIGMLAPVAPPMSDKIPVKVSFLQDEDKEAIPIPGWMRKRVRHARAVKFAPPYLEDRSVAPPFSAGGGGFEDIGGPTAHSEVPSVGESIETPGWEGLSPARRAQAEQFLYQYGTEVGLRRLGEVDPEAAQQFEQERLRSERLRPAEPSRDAPDGEESER